jgi:hypothetical protein
MDAEWNAIPIAERLELLAAIRDVREWRYGDCPPLRPLQPISQAALALHAHLSRGRAIREPPRTKPDKTGQKGFVQRQNPRSIIP